MNALKQLLENAAISAALATFGVEVETTRGTIVGYFDSDSTDMEMLSSLTYSGPVPILRIKSSDAEYLEVEDEIKIEGSFYKIRDIQPDTHNQSVIRLVKN